MKVVILAGGLGTRLSEETDVRPKPMVEIGGMPILWHIMKLYSAYGVNDFIICLGYKGYAIKEFFYHYFLHNSDVTVDTSLGTLEVHKSKSESWKVTLVDTGRDTPTGGRLKRVEKFLAGEETFCLTYGDGLADIDINELLRFHRFSGRTATVTAVRPPGRFGALVLENHGMVKALQEKPLGDGSWINGGFFVLNSAIFSLLEGSDTAWELEPLTTLVESNQLAAYLHHGFWQPMDTLREKIHLNALWDDGKAPWKVWE